MSHLCLHQYFKDMVSHKQALEKKNSALVIGPESNKHNYSQIASSKHFVLLLSPSTSTSKPRSVNLIKFILLRLTLVTQIHMRTIFLLKQNLFLRDHVYWNTDSGDVIKKARIHSNVNNI